MRVPRVRQPMPMSPLAITGMPTDCTDNRRNGRPISNATEKLTARAAMYGEHSYARISRSALPYSGAFSDMLVPAEAHLER
jgi:hypothetical protein